MRACPREAFKAFHAAAANDPAIYKEVCDLNEAEITQLALFQLAGGAGNEDEEHDDVPPTLSVGALASGDEHALLALTLQELADQTNLHDIFSLAARVLQPKQVAAFAVALVGKDLCQPPCMNSHFRPRPPMLVSSLHHVRLAANWKQVEGGAIKELRDKHAEWLHERPGEGWLVLPNIACATAGPCKGPFNRAFLRVFRPHLSRLSREHAAELQWLDTSSAELFYASSTCGQPMSRRLLVVFEAFFTLQLQEGFEQSVLQANKLTLDNLNKIDSAIKSRLAFCTQCTAKTAKTDSATEFCEVRTPAYLRELIAWCCVGMWRYARCSPSANIATVPTSTNQWCRADAQFKAPLDYILDKNTKVHPAHPTHTNMHTRAHMHTHVHTNTHTHTHTHTNTHKHTNTHTHTHTQHTERCVHL